jgi:hypothetical protein
MELNTDLLERIRAALDTAETGDNLVAVAQAAHDAELKHNTTQGAAFVMHSDWDNPRFFTAQDPDKAWEKAQAYIFGLVTENRAEFERINGKVSDDTWLEALLDNDWDIGYGIISEEN